MRITRLARTVLAALVAVLVLVGSAPAASAGEVRARSVATTPAARGFLGVEGVELSDLGYRGPDLAGFDPAALGAPLPAGFAARGRDLGRRLDVLNPQRVGLREAIPLLTAALHDVEPRIRRQEKPSGRCAPPTAVPGRSMHELGLAVDFTWDGASISTRRSPAYRWLATHAWLYGFVNLPSEPWHWSLNGR